MIQSLRTNLLGEWLIHHRLNQCFLMNLLSKWLFLWTVFEQFSFPLVATYWCNIVIAEKIVSVRSHHIYSRVRKHKQVAKEKWGLELMMLYNNVCVTLSKAKAILHVAGLSFSKRSNDMGKSQSLCWLFTGGLLYNSWVNGSLSHHMPPR